MCYIHVLRVGARDGECKLVTREETTNIILYYIGGLILVRFFLVQSSSVQPLAGSPLPPPPGPSFFGRDVFQYFQDCLPESDGLGLGPLLVSLWLRILLAEVVRFVLQGLQWVVCMVVWRSTYSGGM